MSATLSYNSFPLSYTQSYLGTKMLLIIHIFGQIIIFSSYFKIAYTPIAL